MLYILPVCQNSDLASITHFFKIFRKEHAANPKHSVSQWANGTGITNIRKHLFKHHIADWVKACDDKKIEIRGSAALSAVRRFRNLPDSDLEANHPTYSKEAFVDALAEFVIGDDQVCHTFLKKY
jgi:hypothetical protein